VGVKDLPSEKVEVGGAGHPLRHHFDLAGGAFVPRELCWCVRTTRTAPQCRSVAETRRSSVGSSVSTADSLSSSC
jgi:hypothetical protein